MILLLYCLLRTALLYCCKLYVVKYDMIVTHTAYSTVFEPKKSKIKNCSCPQQARNPYSA